MSKIVGLSIALLAGLAAQPVLAATIQASSGGEAELRQCVAMSTTGADRVLTAQWMFAAMAKSPHISSFSTVPTQRKVELDKGFAQLMTRLAIKDCFREIEPLAAANLQGAFELVGRALGEIAMEELMTDKNVDKAIGEYTDYLSKDDFKPLFDSLDGRQSK